MEFILVHIAVLRRDGDGQIGVGTKPRQDSRDPISTHFNETSSPMFFSESYYVFGQNFEKVQ